MQERQNQKERGSEVLVVVFCTTKGKKRTGAHSHTHTHMRIRVANDVIKVSNAGAKISKRRIREKAFVCASSIIIQT